MTILPRPRTTGGCQRNIGLHHTPNSGILLHKKSECHQEPMWFDKQDNWYCSWPQLLERASRGWFWNGDGPGSWYHMWGLENGKMVGLRRPLLLVENKSFPTAVLDGLMSCLISFEPVSASPSRQVWNVWICGLTPLRTGLIPTCN